MIKRNIERKHLFLPNINKFLVFDIIRKHSPISISEIVRLTNLSVPTVVKILKELAAENYIKDNGKGESSGGRRPKLYKFNGDSRFIVGIDFEIPKVRIISVDLADRVIAQDSYSFNIHDDVEKILYILSSRLGEIIRASKGKSKKELIGIGLAISGFIDPKKGVSLSTPRMPHWKNVPIGQIIEREFAVPVLLINDTDARMMAEVEFGIKSMADNLIYVAFNEGLGAGLLINGELISGKFGNAGSISHITVNPSGPRCICGNRGCLEMYASERGVLKRIQEQFIFPEKGSILKTGKLTFDDVIELYKKGDEICVKVIEEASYYMGIGIANVVNLLEVDHIIIGGSIVKAGDAFLRMLKKDIQSHLQGILKVDLKLQFARLKDEEAGAIGALVPIISEFFKGPEFKLNSQKIEIWSAQIHAGRY